MFLFITFLKATRSDDSFLSDISHIIINVFDQLVLKKRTLGSKHSGITSKLKFEKEVAIL